MSILNAYIRDDRAIIAVDTLCKLSAPHLETPEYYQASKAIPFVHANAVIAGRGDFMLMSQVAGMIHSSLNEMMIDQMIDQLKTMVIAALPHSQLFPSELLLAGWSGERRRIIAAHALCEGPKNGFSIQLLSEADIVAPNTSWSADSIPDLSTPTSMKKIAKEQVIRHRSDHPEDAIGGRLKVIEVMQSGIFAYDAGVIVTD